jgi:exodeoxyribonuclease VIII
VVEIKLDLMIDLEGLGTGPETTILTIAAQEFNPLVRDSLGRSYYVRVDLESQADRTIEQGTIDWWATQPPVVRDEAFAEQDRVSLRDALDGLYKLMWQAKRVWAQGPTYDMTILEHAYKSLGIPLPWKYYSVRDSRTLFSLVPQLESYPASHHALEDCCRQILLLWDALEYLKITEIK